jgi:D-alanyl-D-alanine carboxypeptidase (penicillin-binding protein 5/6)
MRLVPLKFVIVGGGVLLTIMNAACSAKPGTAYASLPSSASASASASAKAKASAAPSPRVIPAGPVLTVAGTPGGIKAKGAILADAGTGQVLWSRGPEAQRPMASITKVMTAYLVLQAANLDRQVTVPKAVLNYVAQWGAESDGLHPGEKLTARELLYGLLVQSGADAAYTLASAYGPGMSAFIAEMNATARQLGMSHTHFTSPDGLPYPKETSTYSTPSDLLILAEAAMQSPVFRATVSTVQYHLPKGQGHQEHWWYNDDSLLRSYKGAIGIKTGFTDVAGHCLVFEADRGGRPIIGVVLGSPATGFSASEQDATKMLNWAFSLKQTG